MNMLTFFEALHNKMVTFFSLKLSVSAIIDVGEIVGADLQRSNIGDMNKVENCMDHPNIQ
jgi:hypothetical protein